MTTIVELDAQSTCVGQGTDPTGTKWFSLTDETNGYAVVVLADVPTDLARVGDTIANAAGLQTDHAPGVEPVLFLSPSHLPHDLAWNLTEVEGVVATDIPDGCLLWVPTDPREYAARQSPPIPEPIVEIWSYAAWNGCRQVWFDTVMGQTVPGLTVHEWPDVEVPV